jgi:hypothetical protein
VSEIDFGEWKRKRGTERRKNERVEEKAWSFGRFGEAAGKKKQLSREVPFQKKKPSILWSTWQMINGLGQHV